jgi:hypothetical protein
MSKTIVQNNPSAKSFYAANENNPDEWETDPDFVVI